MLKKLTTKISKPFLFASGVVASSLLIPTNVYSDAACEQPPQRFEPAMVECKTPGWVALTFDDGPHYNTPQILDTLASYDVKASFFVVGNRLQNPYYAQLLQDIIDQGHLVGNHTWSHADMSNLRQVTSESELRKTSDYISQLTQYEMQFMRPPFGKLSLDAALASWTFDYTIAMWNLDSHDYRSTSQWSAQQQLDKIQEAFNSQSPDDSSHILLLHDYSSQTLENLSAIIESALDAGYRIGTMEDCLKL